MKKNQIVWMIALAISGMAIVGCGKKTAPQPPENPSGPVSVQETPATTETPAEQPAAAVEGTPAPAVEAVSQVTETPAAETTQTEVAPVEAAVAVETLANPA